MFFSHNKPSWSWLGGFRKHETKGMDQMDWCNDIDDFGGSVGKYYEIICRLNQTEAKWATDVNGDFLGLLYFVLHLDEHPHAPPMMRGEVRIAAGCAKDNPPLFTHYAPWPRIEGGFMDQKINKQKSHDPHLKIEVPAACTVDVGGIDNRSREEVFTKSQYWTFKAQPYADGDDTRPTRLRLAWDTTSPENTAGRGSDYTGALILRRKGPEPFFLSVQPQAAAWSWKGQVFGVPDGEMKSRRLKPPSGTATLVPEIEFNILRDGLQAEIKRRNPTQRP